MLITFLGFFIIGGFLFKFWGLELIMSFIFFLSFLLAGSSFYGEGFQDFLTYFMVLLTIYFYLVLVLISVKYSFFKSGEYKISLFFLFLSLMLCLFFKNVWWFYIFFEAGLFPLIFFIYRFGYQVERVQASFYLFFYTMFGSFPLMILFLYFVEKMAVSSFMMFPFYFLKGSMTISLIFFFIFFIKLPVYFFHLWLPKAHVEAPVTGSMILAAVLLKLGGYGVVRGVPLFLSLPISGLVSAVLWGSVLSALICVVQSDLKALVAYSSISHMGVMIFAVLLNSLVSLKSFFIIMMGHAFCSSALFFLVNFFYERNLSRQIFVGRGVVLNLFFISTFVFLFLALNFSVPPSFNLFGELLLFMNSWSFHFISVLVLGMTSFLVAFYCIYAYSNLSQGKTWKVKNYNMSADFSMIILIYHLVPSFSMVLLMSSMVGPYLVSLQKKYENVGFKSSYQMVVFLAIFLLLGLLNVYFLAPSATYIVEFFLMSLVGRDIFFVLFWDFFGFLFVSVVLTISAVVFTYSTYYMDMEETRLGFSLLLLSFVVSMILLIMSPSLISLLLGWDGLGVTSYLLVIYYSSASSSVAGMVTFLVNRLGDIFFLGAIGLMFYFFDWEKYTSTFFLLMLFMLVAFSTKSAQVPFSSWLPAAMAAPTPVSSLVHSSTLVTAGLYLMIRFSSIILKAAGFLLWVSILTLLLAGLMAAFEWDLKKLIAFSTLSQLGFIGSSLGMGLVWLSFFHLITHALFKASLFLSAGILIHNADSSQEFRNIFILAPQLFWVASVVNICLLCLCGIPFTSGFYSKDLIIDGGSFSFFLFILYFSGVLFTVIYSFRFFFYSSWFFNIRTSFGQAYEKVYMILVPLAVLIFFALVGGWFFFEGFFSYKYLIVLTGGWKSLYGFFLMLVLVGVWKANFILKGGYMKTFFMGSMWHLKTLFSSKGWRTILSYSSKIQKTIDQGAWEATGPQGVFFLVWVGGEYLFFIQAFIIIFFFVLLLSMFFVV